MDYNDEHHDTDLAGAKRDEPWWWVTRANAWYKLNVAAAIALGVYLLWNDDFYEWLAAHYVLVPALSLTLVSLVGAVPLIGFLRRTGRPVFAVWAILATVLGVFAAGSAGTDAQEYLNYNCWTLAEKKGVETVACAPGDEPRQSPGGYNSLTETEYEGRFCEYVEPYPDEAFGEDDAELARQAERSEEAGVTLWRCE